MKKRLIISNIRIIFLFSSIVLLSSCIDENARFAVLSDIHISLDAVDSEGHIFSKSREILEDTVSAINADKGIKFVLISGDLTQNGLITEHEAFRSIISQINVPVYLIPGNHDIEHPGKEGSSYMKKADFPGYYADYGYSGTNDPYYSAVVYDDILLISLDSTVYDQNSMIGEDYGGYVTKEQLDWLETVLGANGDKRVIVMLHHNVNEHIYTQSTNDFLKDYYLYNASELKKILKDHFVSVVFSGHIHLVDIKEEEGIYDIVTTSLIMYPLSYRVCSIEESYIFVESANVITDPIDGKAADDYAYSLLSGYVRDTLYSLLVLDPYNYPPVTAGAIAATLTSPILEVFEGDENVQSILGMPQEYLQYLQDSPPADDDILVLF